MAQATGRWAEVIQTVNGWLKQQTEPKEKIRLCLHLAKWYGDDLGRPEYAQPYYAQIIQLDPLNVGAMRQLASLYKKAANWQQMGATLTRALEVATNDLDRKETLNDLGELLDGQMQQTDQAIANFQRALEVDPHFLPALGNLERIYAARGQNRELVDVLQRKVPALQDPAETVAAKLRIAQLLETSLGDASRAAQVYREVVDVEPTNIAGLARPRARLRDARAVERARDRARQPARRRDDRAREDRRAHAPRDAPRGALPQGGSVGQAARAGPRDRSEQRRGVLQARAQLPEAASVARSHQHLRSSHRGDGRPQDEGRSLRRHRAGLRRRGRGRRSRDRRLQEHHRPRRPERAGARGAREALRQARRRGAVHRLHDARRGADAGHQAARRVVLPHRQGARREARRPRLGAGALRDGARPRSVAPRDDRGAPPNRDRRGGPRQGGPLLRSGAELHDVAAAARPAARGARQAARPDARGSPERRPRLGGGIRGRRRERRRGDAARRRVRRAAGVGEGRAAARLARSQERQARARRAARPAEQARAGLRGAEQGRQGPQGVHGGAPARSHRPGDHPRARRDLLPAQGLGRGPHELPEGPHRAQRGRDRGARGRLPQARLHQARAGAGQAGDQQLREVPLGRSGVRADARGARLALHGAQGLEAGRRLQAADPRQRLRGRRALPDAQRDRRRLERSGQGAASRHRGARGGARAAAARTPGCSTSSSRSIRRPRTGRR